MLPAGAAARSRTVWLCRPGKANDPCTPGLATTRLSNSGQTLGVSKPRRQRRRRIDCFYVYPTVSDDKGANSDLSIDPEERSIAVYQAARYSQRCRVFAPMYRQVTLTQLLRGRDTISERMRDVAYRSALRGWRTYLRRYNHGRGVVLISHSQGTFVLRRLIADEIDPHRSLRRRLVSAILLGGNVTVRSGGDRGGDFRHIRSCHSPTQVRCVVAFSTFNAPVPPTSLFGRTTAPGLHVLCRNPAALGGGSGALRVVMPSEPFAPETTIGVATTLIGYPQVTASTPWIEYDHAYRGRCSSAGGANVLQIADRPGAPHLHAIPNESWGLHLTDANIALGNLVDLVHRQAQSYLAAPR
jgi:Protein of unknown function (DUF3089)